MAATVSFGRPCASRIYSIFPLRMESKAFVKSKNNSVARRFFPGHLLDFCGKSIFLRSWIFFSGSHFGSS